MARPDFTATLLRKSAGGFAGLAASRTAERAGGVGALEGGFDAWQAHFKSLLGELAAASEDGGVAAFAATLRWMREAFAARGMSTEILSGGLEELAAVLEESLPPAAWASLPPFFEAAQVELAREASAPGRAVVGDQSALVDAYLARLEEGDAPGAITAVMRAVEAGGITVAGAIEGVVAVALHEIGRRWHTDAISVAEEHFASQVSGRLLERLYFAATPSAPNGRSVMLTMIEGDAHDLGLRIVATLFELDGWRTICLGANMPTSDLPRAAATFGVDLIPLGATLNTQRETVAGAIGSLREVAPGLKIMVGGPAFEGCEERAAEIGADGCALLPRRAVELGRALVVG